MSNTPLRTYAGVAGDERQAERRAQLIAAGLALLGSDQDPSLTVRGVCKEAGLAPRYFYESFADRDALAVAVFDQVVADVASTTLQAIETATRDTRDMLTAALANIVRLIGEDPRKGRLLFSPAIDAPVLVERRVASTRLFAQLLLGQVQEHYRVEPDTRLELATEFAVGGLAQALSSWLDGSLATTPEELVDGCIELFLAIGTTSGADLLDPR